VIAAAFAAVALATPSRQQLVQRWLQANHVHAVARLSAGPRARANAVPPDLRTLAQRELASPGRYRLAASQATVRGEPWWLRAWNWIADRWQRFWGALFARAHVGKEAASSLGDVLLALVGLLLLVVAVRLVRNLQIARSPAPSSAEPLDAAASPRALYRDACDAANRGDYGTAALLLFAATVALLDRRGAIDAGRSATVGDLRRSLRGSDASLVGTFDAVAAPFVQQAYAERAVGEPQWEHARTAFLVILSEAA
jgi:hypothetical protein